MHLQQMGSVAFFSECLAAWKCVCVCIFCNVCWFSAKNKFAIFIPTGKTGGVFFHPPRGKNASITKSPQRAHTTEPLAASTMWPPPPNNTHCRNGAKNPVGSHSDVSPVPKLSSTNHSIDLYRCWRTPRNWWPSSVYTWCRKLMSFSISARLSISECCSCTDVSAVPWMRKNCRSARLAARVVRSADCSCSWRSAIVWPAVGMKRSVKKVPVERRGIVRGIWHFWSSFDCVFGYTNQFEFTSIDECVRNRIKSI